jgi:hypothetical protein
VPRNAERKLEYDRNRQKRLRIEDPEGVREAERIRKAAQRARQRAAGEPIREETLSLDDPRVAGSLDKKMYRDWASREATE